jgi:hypothetical protein
MYYVEPVRRLRSPCHKLVEDRTTIEEIAAARTGHTKAAKYRTKGHIERGERR